MGQEDKIKKVVVREYLSGKYSLRELAGVYGIGKTTVHKWVKEAERAGIRQELRGRPVSSIAGSDDEAAAEIRRLRAELRNAELHNKLLNAMIDIAEDDLGVDIRKKRGSGR